MQLTLTQAGYTQLNAQQARFCRKSYSRMKTPYAG